MVETLLEVPQNEIPTYEPVYDGEGMRIGSYFKDEDVYLPMIAGGQHIDWDEVSKLPPKKQAGVVRDLAKSMFDDGLPFVDQDGTHYYGEEAQQKLRQISLAGEGVKGVARALWNRVKK